MNVSTPFQNPLKYSILFLLALKEKHSVYSLENGRLEIPKEFSK